MKKVNNSLAGMNKDWEEGAGGQKFSSPDPFVMTKMEKREKRGSKNYIEEKKVLERLTGIYVDIRHWPGRLAIMDKKNPQTFRKLQIYPGEAVKFYYSARRGVLNFLLDRVGFKFMNSWVFPSGIIESIDRSLKIMKEEFYSHVDQIRERHHLYIQQFLEENPVEAKELNGLKDPKFSLEAILSRFHFEWQFFKLSSVYEEFFQPKFFEQIREMDQKIYASIMPQAQRIWQVGFLNKTESVSRTVSPLFMIRDKLNALKFISPAIVGTLRLMDMALSFVPSKGKIPEEGHQCLKNLVWILKDPVICMEYSKLVQSGKSPQNILRNSFKGMMAYKLAFLSDVENFE